MTDSHDLNTHQLKLAQSYFDQLIDLSQDQQQAQLKQIDDQAIRRYVRTLINIDQSSDKWATHRVNEVDLQQSNPVIETEFGQYQLDTVIGNGGMGTVYLSLIHI